MKDLDSEAIEAVHKLAEVYEVNGFSSDQSNFLIGRLF